MSTTTDKMIDALAALSHAPKLIVTDSQVFGYVYEHKPAESMLTSFSVLFAAYRVICHTMWRAQGQLMP